MCQPAGAVNCGWAIISCRILQRYTLTRPVSTPMIKYIQILGERSSGTNFINSLVKKNFCGVQITKEFGGKHWFLKDHYPRSRPNDTTDAQCIRSVHENTTDTLFLCVLRNPFDWIRSIHSRPYHAYNHSGIPFSQFLRKPWLSFEKARVNRFWPARTDNFWFIEEAGNILQLRSMKIEHWLKLGEKVENIYYLNYEDVLQDNQFMTKVAERFGIELCNANIEGETRYLNRRPDIEYSPQNYPAIADQDLEFIRSELNWELEQRIGYARDDYIP